MSLKERLTEAMKEAMRAKESLRLNTIRMTRSAIKNKEIEQKQELDDAGVMAVLSTLVKQRREAASVYREGDRIELAEKEEAECAVLQEFLPAQLAEDEIREIVEAAVAECGATSMRDMGKVMQSVVAKTTGRADGKLVSAMVKTRLSS